MKKILCLLLVVILLFLSVGCNDQERPSSKSNTISPVFSDIEGLYKHNSKEYDNNAYDTGIGSSQINSNDSIYRYFEECLEDTTDIVKAKFLGIVKISDVYFFDFEISEAIRGSFDSKEISVYLRPMNYMGVRYNGTLNSDTPDVKSYSTYDIQYETGKDYLLLLTRVNATFCEKDFLRFAHDSLVIPLNGEGNPDVSKSKMYETEFISHIKDTSTKEKVQSGKLIECVTERIKDNASLKKLGNNTDKTDVFELFDSATYILVIEPQSKKLSSFSYYEYFGSERYCKVAQIIKGEPYISESGTCKITLSTEKIEDGKTYLVALDENYSLLSRSAIFPWTD